MAQEILEDVGGTLEFVAPVEPTSSTSVTCALVKPTESTSYETGTATLSSNNYSVASVTDRDTVTLDGWTGMVIGQTFMYVDPSGWKQRIKISNMPGSYVIELESPFIEDPQVGGSVYPLSCTFSVSAATAADRAMQYRCEWLVASTTDDDVKHQTLFHVVRTQFEDSVTPSEAYRYAESNMAGAVLSWDPGRSVELANRASEKVRREIQSSGAYPHLIGESDAFKTAGLYALKLELAMMGFVPPGFDPGVYATTVQESLKSEIRQTLSSLTWLDSDDDGIVDSDEGSGPYTIKVSRR